MPLATKADALRELSVVAELGGVLEGFSPGGLGGGGTAPKAAQPCQVAGEEDYGTGTGNYRFNYFPEETQLRPVDYSRTVQRSCSYNGANAGVLYTVDGFKESGAASDGSALRYVLTGSGSSPRKTIEERRSNGSVTYRVEELQLGRLQQKTAADGNRERRLVYRYELKDSDQNRILAALGEDGSPFVIRDLDDVESFYSGSYAYETSESGCSGVAGVTTLAAITRNDGRVTGGRLQFDAGDKRAVIVFNADGTGSVQLNGAAPVALTAQDISKALAGSDCIPD
ncbi:hypothetical protein C3942_05360 [Solimonas fluminis]|uniref:Uncharacterized protein n=1 Tax=Solimonas fluminis TaxID=2086571 RepID=A0A2S5TJE6_9GAMM|nr:hypothetical protein C3942_05360 [Solimonas fluminis]